MKVCFRPVVLVLLTAFLAGLNATNGFGQAPQDDPSESLPVPHAQDLPRWRGFNLLEMFHLDWSNKPFVEEDFRLIHELGFNFVRLPMDYRTWIQDGDWNRFDEEKLKQVDQAVAWGKQYGIHVCISFHRAPGYTVASPAEETNLWVDDETQRVCASHWAMFAQRYREIPNRNLSFNLFNEPPNEAGQGFIDVVEMMVAAIRAEDPKRLIISDGLSWGQQPVLAFTPLQIAQATRGYTPHEITHYKASWVANSDKYPTPTWPRPQANGLIYCLTKPDVAAETKVPLRILGAFDQATPIRMRVQTVSTKAHLVVTADGEPFFEKTFSPGPGKGDWKEVVYQPQWESYQNIYDRDYTATIPAGTKQIEFSVTQGDWMSISEIGLQSSDGNEHSITLSQGWEKVPAQISYDALASRSVFKTTPMEDRQWLWDQSIVPWIRAREHNKIGVIVGEFGCHNQTPHEVTLAWMEDVLANWKNANFGWAVWNFRGSFGILDSDRSDVEYESFHGHKLDRKMLDLLQRY